MSFRVKADGLSNPLVWLSIRTSAGTRHTQLFSPAQLRAYVPPPCAEVLVTVVAVFNKRYEVVGTQRYTPVHFHDLGAVAPLVRVTGESHILGTDAVTRRATIFPPIHMVAEPRRAAQVPQQNGTLYQMVAATADGTVTTPLLFGNPFLKRAWFADQMPVRVGLWQRYVDRAVILSGFNGSVAAASKITLDILLATTLQGCTGVYDKERIDDRSTVDLTFGENCDCDDQAATCCALALAVMHEHGAVGVAMSSVARAVLDHLLQHYRSAAVVVGKARSPTNPGSPPFGHAWAVLTAAEGRFTRGALHVEPTAPMTQHTPDQSVFTRVYSTDEYNKRSAACLALMKQQNISGNRLVGVRVARPEFYSHPCTAATPSHMYVWPKHGAAPWLSLIASEVQPPPPQPTHGRVDPDELHHLPNRAVHIPPNYHRVTAATPRLHAPHDWVGLVAAPLHGPVTSDVQVVDSFNVIRFVVPPPKKSSA